MDEDLSAEEKAKSVAGQAAAGLVEAGMKVGLGTGSTANYFVSALAARTAEGLDILTVATSSRTADRAREQGLKVITLDEAGWLDLTVDGADEVDGHLRLIKGGGGALLQEKIVATASRRMIVIADAGKEVERLGAFPLPVEVTRFGVMSTQAHIQRLLADADVNTREMNLRMAGDAPYLTDEGNLIVDLHLGRIGDPDGLAQELVKIAGVVESGLFVGICDGVIFGQSDGSLSTRGIELS